MWNKHPGDDADGAGICYKCAHTGQAPMLVCPVAKKMPPLGWCHSMGTAVLLVAIGRDKSFTSTEC